MKQYTSYPSVSQDPEMDFQVRNQLFGRGECMTIGEKRVNGNILVYLNEMSEGEEVYDKEKYIGRRCYSDIIVCGYRKTSFLLGKRVQFIPEKEKEEVKNGLLKIFSNEGKNIKNIYFW